MRTTNLLPEQSILYMLLWPPNVCGYVVDTMSIRGRILIEGVVSLGIASIILAALVTLFTTISQTAVRISKAHSSVVATTKVYAAVSTALRVRERNRLSFATQITRSPQLRLPHGVAHPLAVLKGNTGPRDNSDILSVVEVAHRCRGTVVQATTNNDSITMTVCGLACRPQPDEFKSFLLYGIDGARQIVGEVSLVSQYCGEVRGTAIEGLVTEHRLFTSMPLVFLPVEREYSLFVDRTDTFRIASHVGMRIVENQPVAQGIEKISITPIGHERGVSTFHILIQPRIGKVLAAFVTPSLAGRFIWNEILP